MLRRLLIGCAVWLVTATAASAIFAPFDVINVPVDRLARNLEALIAERPADSRLWLNLARLHAMAYALKVELVPVVRGNEAGGVFLGRAQMPFTPKPAANAAAGRVARAHLQRALDAYRAALALDRKNPVVHLGYAWCLARAGRTPDAIAEYRQVLDLAWEVERKPIKIYEGAQSITEEAASLLIPLLDPKRDADEIARLRARVETINRQAMRWVTPIAVPLEDGLSPSDFLDGRASVAFDADGSGERRPWTWITPQAGWLVHDIHRTGHVTSALQLFGSVTWWLFWENGDEALQALDDDRDGVLGGSELDGLAIWRDANSNGFSEPGEVRPLEDWQIVSVSYAHRRHHPRTGLAASAPAGVTLANGSTRPTFDVVLRTRPTS